MNVNWRASKRINFLGNSGWNSDSANQPEYQA
jgi:hypothetical protein